MLFTQDLKAQQPELIIEATVRSKQASTKKSMLCFKEDIKKHSLHYIWDSITNQLIANQYSTEQIQTITKDRKRTRHKLRKDEIRWKKAITSNQLNKIYQTFTTDRLDIEKSLIVNKKAYQHTTWNIYLKYNGEVIQLMKSNPHSDKTPWTTHDNGYVLNPEIEEVLLELLPSDFLLRNELLLAKGG